MININLTILNFSLFLYYNNMIYNVNKNNKNKKNKKNDIYFITIFCYQLMRVEKLYIKYLHKFNFQVQLIKENKKK